MSSGRHMGPSEVQKLILGQWVDIVGQHHRHHHDEDDDRGVYGERERREREQYEAWLRQQQQQQYGYGYGYPYQQPYQQPYQAPYQTQLRPRPTRYQQPYPQPTVNPYTGQPYPQQYGLLPRSGPAFPGGLPGQGGTVVRDHRTTIGQRGHGGGGGGGFHGGFHGGGHRFHDGRRWRHRGWGYPYGYGYDGGAIDGGDYDDSADDDVPPMPMLPAVDPTAAIADAAAAAPAAAIPAAAPAAPADQGAPAGGAAVGRWGHARRVVRYDRWGNPHWSTVVGHGGDNGGIPPRNWLVEQAGPDRAQREVLPMSTGVPILPTQSAQITGRPQAPAWRCERFVISNAGTAGGAADWIVNDIKIGNRSQFVQSGDVPGDMFATNAIDTYVSFETAQTAMDVVVVVTYIGMNESGVPFYASMVGTAAL